MTEENGTKIKIIKYKIKKQGIEKQPDQLELRASQSTIEYKKILLLQINYIGIT